MLPTLAGGVPSSQVRKRPSRSLAGYHALPRAEADLFNRDLRPRSGVNYFYSHRNDKTRKTAPSRAAGLTRALLFFRKLTETCVSFPFREALGWPRLTMHAQQTAARA